MEVRNRKQAKDRDGRERRTEIRYRERVLARPAHEERSL